MSHDTIAAIATAFGRGGVGIVRTSGPQTRRIAEAILGKCPPPRHAELLPFRDAHGEVLDSGIALFFSQPHSFTGEDVLELQAHGGPVVLDMLLHRVFELGARPARAGEFSERAFLNDKLDLAQAEAIADLIDADSEQAARAATRTLNGAFSSRIHGLVEQLIELRLYVEAALDFPDEEIDFLSDGHVTEKLKYIDALFTSVFAAARQGRLLKEGMTLVIAGKPNAGKSSLLNQLAGSDTAIVTDIPGTTRDSLREHIQIDGLPLHVIDTAGLRDTDDPVEMEGVRRAWQQIENADRILLVVDDQAHESDDSMVVDKLPDDIGVTRIHNKIDISQQQPRIESDSDPVRIYLSAKTGEGMDLLREHLKTCMGYSQSVEGVFSARSRHISALETAYEHLKQAHQNLENLNAGELVAEELRLGQEQLNQITGEFTADDLLGRIFSSFCIGK